MTAIQKQRNPRPIPSGPGIPNVPVSLKLVLSLNVSPGMVGSFQWEWSILTKEGRGHSEGDRGEPVPSLTMSLLFFLDYLLSF